MIAYFDCFNGVSGDMILGALLDAGADFELMKKTVGLIDLGDVEVSTERVKRGSFQATQVSITGGRSGVARGLQEASDLISAARMDPEIAAAAIGSIRSLAEAEAQVHGIEPQEVRFHELDGADTIVDTVGAAVGLASLGINRVESSAIATSRGTAETEHGVLPLPAPGVLELMKGTPIYHVDGPGELATPTGLAILKSWAANFGPLPPMKVAAVGYGAGAMQTEQIPNLLRLIVGEPAEPLSPDRNVVVEASIDDMNPELYQYVIKRLLQVGASDAWVVPAIGKNERPGAVLAAIGPTHLEEAFRSVMLAETTTIGVRSADVQKRGLHRRIIEVEVEGMAIRVKVASRGGDIWNMAPEYRDCAEVAQRTGLPIKDVFELARHAAQPGGRERS